MSDPLNELFDEKPAAEAAPVEPEQVEVAPEPEAPEPAEGKGEPPAAPPAAPEDKPQSIPISALMDERDKRQAAERRAQEFERRLQEFEASQQKPDFYDNPEAVLQQERAQFQRAMWNERLNMSEVMARQQHGDETVTAATEAFMQEAARNPALSMDLQRQANPYGFVVNWHKQQQFLKEVGSDPVAYKERLRQEWLAEQQAAQPAPATPVQTTKPTMPPRSIAAAPSAGSSPSTGGSSFDALFG